MDSLLLQNHSRSSYENLLLGQPQLRTLGLWRVGQTFYIVCPEVETSTTDDGQPIRDWFYTNARIMGTPVSLVVDVPPNAVKVPPRTLDELATLKGDAVTVMDLLLDLMLLLPKTFPRFGFADL